MLSSWYITCFSFKPLTPILVSATERSRGGKTSHLERPVQSRHSLFQPIAAQLILTNHRQSTSGSAHGRKADIIYHQRRLRHHTKTTDFYHLESFQYLPLIHPRSFFHHGLTFINPRSFTITYYPHIQISRPPSTRSSAILHTSRTTLLIYFQLSLRDGETYTSSTDGAVVALPYSLPLPRRTYLSTGHNKLCQSPTDCPLGSIGHSLF